MHSRLAFFFQAEDGIRDVAVTGVQTCALPISGSAPQLRSTQGELHRRDCSCKARATSSLPTPLSPVTRTEASVWATRLTISITRRMAALGMTAGNPRIDPGLQLIFVAPNNPATGPAIIKPFQMMIP